MVTDAILLGGGTGKRFSADSKNGSLPKQFQNLGQKPVLIHALHSLVSLNCFRQIVIAVPKEHFELSRELLDSYPVNRGGVSIQVIVGGERRQDSSQIALEALEKHSSPPTRVLIHDASRPYLSRTLLGRIKEKLWDRSYGAWVPVIPVVDTLKKVENHQVVQTISRSDVHRVQTPQIFEYSVIRTLMQKAKDVPEMVFTDDASLCEYYGIPVGVFEGDVKNLKLTYDFELDTLRKMITDVDILGLR